MDQATDWQIFISYSHKDLSIVQPLAQLIRISGAAVFRDEDSIQPGKRWALVIAESLEACRTVVVFWSENASLSKAVEDEYRTGIEKRKDVVPVLLDDTVLPLALSEYQWIDMRDVVKSAIRRGSDASEETQHSERLERAPNWLDYLARAMLKRERPAIYSEDELSAILDAFANRILPPDLSL